MVSGLKAELLVQARALGFNPRSFNKLDDALEWCEDQILWERASGRGGPSSSIVDQGVVCKGRSLIDAAVPQPLAVDKTGSILARYFMGASQDLLTALMGLAERQQLSIGSVAMEENQPMTSMFMCLSGKLSLYRGLVRMPKVIHKTIGLEVSAKQDVGPRVGVSMGDREGTAVGHLVRGMGPGDTVCEAAILGPCVSTLSGIAESPCELWALSREKVFQLETSNKPLAMELYKAISWQMAQFRGDTESRGSRSLTSSV